MNPNIDDDEAEGQVVGLVVGDLTLRANAALKYLDWYEGVMGPRWIGTERGAGWVELRRQRRWRRRGQRARLGA